MLRLATVALVASAYRAPAPLARAPRPRPSTLAPALSDEDLFGGAARYEEAPARPHGYECVGDVGAVDVARVDAILTARSAAKRRRDFVVADALRDELRRDLGVMVDDRDRSWRLWSPGGGRGRPRTGGSLPTEHGYARDASDDADVDVARVDELLLQRLHAKFLRDFSRADAVRDDLTAMGVRVHDGRKVWRAGVGAANADPWTRPEDVYAYQPSPGAADVDDAAVRGLISRRAVARRRKHWDHADELLDELLRLGVVVDDKQRVYRAVQEYACSTPETVADAEAVAALVAERSLLKLRRKFAEADELRCRILDEHDVRIDDAKLVWWKVEREGEA